MSFINRKLAALLSGVIALVIVRTYQSMFTEETWNWKQSE